MYWPPPRTLSAEPADMLSTIADWAGILAFVGSLVAAVKAWQAKSAVDLMLDRSTNLDIVERFRSILTAITAGRETIKLWKAGVTPSPAQLPSELRTLMSAHDALVTSISSHDGAELHQQIQNTAHQLDISINDIRSSKGKTGWDAAAHALQRAHTDITNALAAKKAALLR